ncbi:hypothetical protein P7C70_g5769, partial [Phenoliferia sp. Uapishka_3]
MAPPSTRICGMTIIGTEVSKDRNVYMLNATVFGTEIPNDTNVGVVVRVFIKKPPVHNDLFCITGGTLYQRGGKYVVSAAEVAHLADGEDPWDDVLLGPSPLGMCISGTVVSVGTYDDFHCFVVTTGGYNAEVAVFHRRLPSRADFLSRQKKCRETFPIQILRDNSPKWANYTLPKAGDWITCQGALHSEDQPVNQLRVLICDIDTTPGTSTAASANGSSDTSPTKRKWGGKTKTSKKVVNGTPRAEEDTTENLAA